MQTLKTHSQKIPFWVKALASDSFHDVHAITGGLGSGKTTGSAIAFVYNILNNPTVPLWWSIAPTYTKVDDTLIPVVVDALRRWFDMLPDRDYTLLRSKPPKIKFHQTNQTITMHSGDRPELMVGATIGGYWITEAGLCKREVWEGAGDRARDVRAKKIVGILEGTPEGDNYYMHEFNFEKSNAEKKYRRFKLHTDDNKENLDPGYIERLARRYEYAPEKLKSYRYGEFVFFNVGDCYSQFVESRNVAEVKPDPMLPIDLCYDFNHTPLCWTAWQKQTVDMGYYRFQREVCVNEASLNMHNLFESAVEFSMMHPPETYHKTPIRLWGDRSGYAKSHKADKDFDVLAKYLRDCYQNVTIEAPREVTPVRASVEVFNKMFLYERAVIGSHCKNLRNSFAKCKWKNNDIEKTTGETHTHHQESARSRIFKLYRDTDFNNFSSIKITGGNW